ncbi:LexA family transcriptional regulator [Shumkonia mesophila]|uniref:hypothetical protein n=1 Tax=Shumkonia mesophila TaxID=2838854 RepID=UPI00293491E7|nr:hypothetical protein [Shumkonia mesophila]
MRKLVPLSPIQSACLGVIAEYWADLRRAPTFRELRDELDYRSLDSIARLVAILTDKGWLRPRRPNAKHALIPAADVVLPPEGPVEMTTSGQAFLALAQYDNGRV